MKQPLGLTLITILERTIRRGATRVAAGRCIRWLEETSFVSTARW